MIEAQKARIAEIRKRLAEASPGPWELQDSNSWRRIGSHWGDGNILRPTNHPRDNHPDLDATYETLRFIAAAPEDIRFLLSLISES